MSQKIIQVVLHDTLLEQVDRAAAREGVNRSAWVRVALATRLLAEARLERERRQREGYEQHPVQPDEFDVEPAALAWPDGEKQAL